MKLPGFTAESSLGPALGHYGGATMSGSSGAGVLPMQFTNFESIFGVIRCCQFINGRFRCVTRPRRPWENCRCVRTVGGPFIICEPLVAQADF
jgi:hypothetical protein